MSGRQKKIAVLDESGKNREIIQQLRLLEPRINFVEIEYNASDKTRFGGLVYFNTPKDGKLPVGRDSILQDIGRFGNYFVMVDTNNLTQVDSRRMTMGDMIVAMVNVRGTKHKTPSLWAKEIAAELKNQFPELVNGRRSRTDK